MNMKLNSIKLKISLITVAIILFFGIAAVIGIRSLVINNVSKLSELNLLESTSNGALVFDQIFNNSINLVKNISQDSFMVNFVSSPKSIGSSAINNINQQLSKYNLGNNYSAIYLLDNSGKAIASTDESFINQDYSFRQYFIKSTQGQSYADVNYGVTSNKLGYYFSSPIYDQSQLFIGTAVVKLDPAVIKQAFDHLARKNTNNLMIVDRYGVVVEASQIERKFRSLGILNPDISIQVDQEKKYSDIPIEPLQYQEVLDKILTQPNQSIVLSIPDHVDEQEEKVFISPFSQNSFYLVNEVGNSKIIDSASSIAGFVSLVVSIAAISATILLIITLTRLLSPIGQLSQMAREISSGNFNVINPVNSDDEISVLGDALEKMAYSLKSRYHELETIVANRTQKLKDQTVALSESQLAIQNLLEDTQESKSDLEKYKKAVDFASDHVIITDVEGIIIYANEAATKLTGYTLSEIIGKKAGAKELWGGLMPKLFYRQMWKTIKIDKKVFRGEILNHKKNGQQYVSQSSISPVLDAKGDILFFVGIERDATLEKEIDRMKSEFVSFASHQLRTPLSAMKWFAEMLLSGDAGKLSSQQSEFVQNIYDSNERMVALVKDLLDISRIESGRIIINPVPTDLVKLVNGVLTEVKVKAKAKKQKITTDFDKTLSLVNLDPSLIRNVYINLLTNAIKYTPDKGKISIKLSLEGKNLLSEVTDNGFGIPLSQQDQTFNKFFRATNAVKKETEGTGLGLYLVKSVIESSGGKIWFKSTEGEGTSFWFSLPLKGIAKVGQIHLGS